MNLYSTSEAARYLGLSVVALKKHIYQIGDLIPDKKIGNALIFTQETLDMFQAKRKPVGRPKRK